MNNIHSFLTWFYLLLLPFLDRWGGGGFPQIEQLPPMLKKGFRQARIFGIPFSLFLLSLTFGNFVLLICLAILFSLNLQMIEDKNWTEITLWCLAFFVLLTPVSGIFGLIPAAWFALGIYLSNTGIRGRKLDWFYVELIRGLLIAVGAFAYAHS